MELTAKGGSLILLSPTNNFSGHGFHQLSPGFVFAALGKQNGFAIQRMLVHENRKYASVYEVTDPREHGQRIMLCNGCPVFLKAWAVRERVKTLFEILPQQPDWEPLWQRKHSSGGERTLKARMRSLLRLLAPRLLAEYQRIRMERSQQTGFKAKYYRKTIY